jgi:hypothetical protein
MSLVIKKIYYEYECTLPEEDHRGADPFAIIKYEYQHERLKIEGKCMLWLGTDYNNYKRFVDN